MNRNTKEMRKYDKIETLSTEVKSKLVDAFKSGDNEPILNKANELGVTDFTIRNHIWKWLQILKSRDTANILNDIPKDLSFTERLQIALNLNNYKYEDTLTNTPS